MRFPELLHVQLASSTGTDVTNVLVVLNIRYKGKYYFGTLVGLTDQFGRATTSRAEIESAFASDQRTFPMDYKVSLADCDDVVGVSVQGGRDSAEAKNALVPGLVEDSAIELWNRARNEALGSTLTRVDLCKLSDHPSVVVSL